MHCKHKWRDSERADGMLPNAWIQRCSLCGVYEDELMAAPAQVDLDEIGAIAAYLSDCGNLAFDQRQALANRLFRAIGDA